MKNKEARQELQQIWREEDVTKEGPLGILLPPGVQGIASSIARPNIDANNFELKPAFISIVQQSQFGGTPLEDPNLHLIFLEVCNTLKLNGVSTDTI